MPVQWVHLGGEVLVASSKKAWIQYPELGAIQLDRPMRASLPGTLETTRHLLDGAIVAAERANPPAKPPPMSDIRWAWDLLNQWFIASHSVMLLEQSVGCYARLARTDLAEFARERLEGELGHDQFPLDDLGALGYDAAALVRELAPEPVAAALIELATDCLDGDEPTQFLGYIHAMERHAIRVPHDWFDTLAGVLPPDVDAASGLRAHATDLDLEHVDEAVAFFARLPATDRAAIARGCFLTAQIRCAAGEPASEAELRRRLSPYLNHPPSLSHQQQGALR